MTKHYIIIQNKKYYYQLEPDSKETTRVICDGANIDQPFLNEDIPELLSDLPNLIIDEKAFLSPRDSLVFFREC